MTSKTIAKNTVFLYIRMFFTMGVTLYTSRVVLNTFGVEDYGIYSIVGGIITLFGFFNSAMTAATQRFLSCDIGRNDTEQLKQTFNAALNIHISIGIFIIILAETFGLWFVNNKLNLPLDRMREVHWVYQFSILTFFLGIIQVPYDALIVAWEKMEIYAIMCLAEVILKLITVYLLVVFSCDKLILYAGLLFLVAFIARMVRIIYCKTNYTESRYQFYFGREIYLKLIAYSGWNLFGNIASVARGQGINVILNLFFGTILNATYGITLQVQSVVSLFVTNFQMAVNPQIIKNYAQGNIEQSKKLIFQSAKFSYFLMFIIACPIVYNIDFILEMWLKKPPEYISMFVILCLISLLIDCISGPLMTGAQATGKIKWYQIIIGSLIFLCLPMSYFLINVYKEPVVVFYVIIAINILSLIFRLFFLKKMLDFDIRLFMKEVLLKIIAVTVLVNLLIVSVLFFVNIENQFLLFIIKSSFIVFTSVFMIYTIGLNRQERNFIAKYIFNKK